MLVLDPLDLQILASQLHRDGGSKNLAGIERFAVIDQIALDRGLEINGAGEFQRAEVDDLAPFPDKITQADMNIGVQVGKGFELDVRRGVTRRLVRAGRGFSRRR